MIKYNRDDLKRFFTSLTPEEIAEINEKNQAEHEKQAAAFREGYKRDFCYLCGKPFKTISHSSPCSHWLLRRCKFKKKDFPRIYSIFSYHNIAAFLRWCANQEKFLININDLVQEKDNKKILNNCIRWKNIEWTVDCSFSDFSGHPGTAADFPHYHFQMRIDSKPFIDFSDFHIPFTNEDVFYLTLIQAKLLHHDFGTIGAGMQEAISVPLEKVLEHASSANNTNDATYHFSTMIDASQHPISGKEVLDIQQEAKHTGKSFALIAQQRLQGRATVNTIISPAESIPDIRSRHKHKR